MEIIQKTSLKLGGVEYKQPNKRDGSFFIAFKTKNYPYYVDLRIIGSPTGNCQLFSMFQFNAADSTLYTKQDYIDILKLCSKFAKKPIALLDIKEHFYQRLKRLGVFSKENVIKTSPYRSTNGSRMRVVLVNCN